MNSPQVVHHALLRPCVLHILRAAGYHSTRPSVLDTLTDIAGRYILTLAEATAEHSMLNHGALEVAIEDVRMAMQDCGAILPEKIMEDQIYDDEEDVRGVTAFVEWAMGAGNKEIRRIALEGADDSKEDYLTGLLMNHGQEFVLIMTALKKRHDKTGEETRYQGTAIGKAVEVPRAIVVEGSDITSVEEWANKLRKHQKSASVSTTASSRQSSDLSSLDGTMDDDHEMEDAYNT